MEDQVSPEAYRQLLSQMQSRVESDENLSDARRESLMGRLRAAMSAENPDSSTIYALRNIANTMRTQADSQLAFLREYSIHTGMTLEQARERWNELENGIDRTRGAADPTSITDATLFNARHQGISRETGSLHAFALMSAEADAVELANLRQVPKRFTAQPILSTNAIAVTTSDNPNGDPLRVVGGGYDPRSAYAEVSILNERTNEVTTYHYKGVNAHTWAQVNSPQGTEAWNRQLRSSYWNQITDEYQVLRAAGAPRCGLCGQFSDVNHGCPVGSTQPIASFRLTGPSGVGTSYQKVPVSYTDTEGNARTGEIRVSLPLVNDFRTAGRDGAILLENVREHMYYGYGSSARGLDGTVEGQLGILRGDDGQVIYQTSGLTCSCVTFRGTGTCSHIGKYVEAVRTRLNPPARTPAAALTPEQRAERVSVAQARAEVAASADWTRDQDLLEDARRTWRSESEVVYSEDYEAFSTALAAATDRVVAKNGQADVPYMRENALGGMATRGSGQAFGMEIEYEFPPGTDTAEANRRIGLALRAANLTDHDTQQQYHAATTAGFRDYHVDPSTGNGTWSWERDGSVNGGELVTPGMYDEPETWDKLAQAVQILKDNGAVASVRAGAHVHVGTGFFGGDVKKYGELARVMSQHEDILFRLAQNPERGEHRQGSYTAPLAETPSGGWRDISHLRSWQGGRTRALNLTHVATPVDQANVDAGFAPSNASRSAKDHPEFRIYDSTLDIGIMQTQIKLSVAMTHAAARNAELGGTVRGKEEIGSHAERIRVRGRRRPTEEDIKEETATFRSFLDTLFTRKEDKEQVVALFAATKWNKPDRGNKRHVDSVRANRATVMAERAERRRVEEAENARLDARVREYEEGRLNPLPSTSA
jgi:hypothetical protein